MSEDVVTFVVTDIESDGPSPLDTGASPNLRLVAP